MIAITFEEIKKYYDMNLWSKKNVAYSVAKGKITQEEYKMIIGENYIK